MMRLIVLLLLGMLPWMAQAQHAAIYEVTSGTIRFHSDAPQELIRAASSRLKGVLDLKNRTFAFRIPIITFQGFNSPLQQEHFNENYMETTVYPEATYSGKIIEDVDLTRNGEYTVRTKGKMRIHGVEQERIIKSHIIVKNGVMTIHSDFIVALADHNIKIPRVVYEKLSPEINVSVNATLQSKSR